MKKNIPVVAFIIDRGQLGVEVVIPDIPTFGVSEDNKNEAIALGNSELIKFAKGNKFEYNIHNVDYFTKEKRKKLGIPEASQMQIYFVNIKQKGVVTQPKTISVSLPSDLLSEMDDFAKANRMKRSGLIAIASEEFLKLHAS